LLEDRETKGTCVETAGPKAFWIHIAHTHTSPTNKIMEEFPTRPKYISAFCTDMGVSITRIGQIMTFRKTAYSYNHMEHIS
jgi:hypothetical protein